MITRDWLPAGKSLMRIRIGRSIVYPGTSDAGTVADESAAKLMVRDVNGSAVRQNSVWKPLWGCEGVVTPRLPGASSYLGARDHTAAGRS